VGGKRIICLLTQEPPAKSGASHPGRASATHVNHALRELHKIVEKEKLTSLALPRLATGVGGLEWSVVKPLIEQHLGSLKIPVLVYEQFVKGKKALRLDPDCHVAVQKGQPFVERRQFATPPPRQFGQPGVRHLLRSLDGSGINLGVAKPIVPILVPGMALDQGQGGPGGRSRMVGSKDHVDAEKGSLGHGARSNAILV
jgi:hypothetical protein